MLHTQYEFLKSMALAISMPNRNKTLSFLSNDVASPLPVTNSLLQALGNINST